MGHRTDGPPLTSDEQLALSAIMRRRVAEQRVPGAVAGLWIGDRSWVQAVGVGNLQTAAPITPGDHVRIASISKTFVATVLLQLVEEGNLSLDDPLDTFINGVPNGEAITVRHLLGMTSGTFNYINDAAFETAYVGDPLLSFPREAVIEILQRHEPDFAPGEQVQYSDSNYFLAGFIIERLTGRTAAEAIRARVLDPLALHDTSFPNSPEMPDPHARGYAADPGSDLLRDLTASNPEVPWTAGAMISTLGDLRVWGEALAKGTLLSPEMQRERLHLQRLSFGPGRDFGYGLGIMETHGFLGHAGAIFGYSSWMLHSPEEDATLIVLANRGETETEFASGIVEDVLKLLFPGHFASV